MTSKNMGDVRGKGGGIPLEKIQVEGPLSLRGKRILIEFKMWPLTSILSPQKKIMRGEEVSF